MDKNFYALEQNEGKGIKNSQHKTTLVTGGDPNGTMVRTSNETPANFAPGPLDNGVCI